MPEIDSEIIGDRFEDHLIYAEEYISRLSAGEDGLPEMRVNKGALFIAVKSTYDDISRYKSYHSDDPRNNLANAVKRSAYLCKWLCRTKPLENKVPLEGENLDDITSLLINGAYALYLSRVHIGAELKNPFFFTPDYLDEFQYDLLYRNLGDDGLLHIFQNIYTAVKVNRAGVLEFVNPSQVESIFDS